MLKEFLTRLYDARNILIGYFLRIFPMDNKKIVMVNFWGRGYSDNPKYIADFLLKHHPDLKIVWIVKDVKNANFPERIKLVKYRSLRSLYEYATAKIWIDNSRKQYYIKKRPGQYYIQTWHGGFCLKKIEGAAQDNLSKTYIRHAKNDSKMADYFISNNAFRTEVYQKYFWYAGSILEYGLPRNDIFYGINKRVERKRLYSQYHIDPKAKLILYVPTFRQKYFFNYNLIDAQKIISTLEKRTGKKYHFITKLHPNISRQASSPSPTNTVLSSSEDINRLLPLADIIISDYSGVVFDAAMIKKPVYLFAPDYRQYLAGRGFFFEYGKLPFSTSYTPEELSTNISTVSHRKYAKQLADFLTKVNFVDDGKATERVCDLIIKLMEGK